MRTFLFLISTVVSLGALAAAQPPKKVTANSQKQSANLANIKVLTAAVALSRSQPDYTITIDTSVQKKSVFGTFRRSGNRYAMLETRSDGFEKEAIEIAGQRYQRKDKEWVKVRKDPFPLREQVDSYFPLKFISRKSDPIKVKNPVVVHEGEEMVDGLMCEKYRYSVKVDLLDIVDSGAAWVEKSTGLLKQLEIDSVGIFGPVTSIWKYEYGKANKIEPPQTFVERDWIN